MNFNKIQLVKCGPTKVKILNDKFEHLFFDITDIVTPFGSEDISGRHYINWEIDDKETEEFLLTIDKSFKEEYDKNNDVSDLTWNSAIIKRPFPYNSIFRTKNISETNFLPNTRYNIRISLDSIWLHKKTKSYGLLWHTSNVN